MSRLGQLLDQARAIVPVPMTARERAEWGVYNVAIDRDWSPEKIEELIQTTTLVAEISDAERRLDVAMGFVTMGFIGVIGI